MTGFIRGLFGGNKAQQAEPTKPVEQPKPVQKVEKVQKDDGSYLLSLDEARTFGDAEYMRKVYEIKKSFPKNKREEAMKYYKPQKATSESPNGTSEMAASSETTDFSAAKAERRKADSSLDMFRNMAKDIKKP